MRIIQARQHHKSVSHSLCWDYEGQLNHGFAFDCNEKGEIDPKLKSNPCGWASYQSCLKGETQVRVDVKYDRDSNPIPGSGHTETRKLVGPRLESREHSYTEPAVGLCNHCDSEVVLYGFTNTCEKCETDYNMSGQELAPREQWGEETGESLSDILSIR